jgi:AbrB family looped-hinge helix DNA binding protein
MNRITLTSKGQVTIPISARRALNLSDGDELIASYNQETRSIQLRKPSSIDEISARLSSYIKPGAKPVTDVSAYYEKHRGEKW